MNRAVTILGCGPSYIECPCEGEMWVVFYQILTCRVIHRVFGVHDWGDYDNDTLSVLRIRQKNEGLRIVGSVAPPEHMGLNVELYPIEDILNEFKVRYFRDLVCYMFALAIYEKFDRINIYGIDCLHYTPYVEEKAPAEFWCGVARARGIELNTASMSTLCKLYGADDSFKIIGKPLDKLDFRMGFQPKMALPMPQIIGRTPRLAMSVEELKAGGY